VSGLCPQTPWGVHEREGKKGALEELREVAWTSQDL